MEKTKSWIVYAFIIIFVSIGCILMIISSLDHDIKQQMILSSSDRDNFSNDINRSNDNLISRIDELANAVGYKMQEGNYIPAHYVKKDTIEDRINKDFYNEPRNAPGYTLPGKDCVGLKNGLLVDMDCI